MTRELPIGAAPGVMRTPRIVDVSITSRCNLRCRYCYFFDNPAVAYEDQPTEEWVQFFDELGRCGVMNVTLSGGEPLLREDLPTLIASIVRNRMRFSVLSNGGSIDDEIAALLFRSGRCDAVQVSVDGSGPKTHDLLRGKGSFEAAVRGIRTLRRHGVPTTARVTIHRHNVGDLEAIARLLLHDLGLPGFSTNASCCLGTCQEHAGEVLLDTQQWQLAMETLLRLAEEHEQRITAMAGPLYTARRWREMEQARLGQKPPFPNGGSLTGCGCASVKIAVRPDGVIVPCTMLPHLELGRINRTPLVEVWQTSPDLNSLRQRATKRLMEFEFCTDCDYMPYCTGECPAVAYSLTGQVDHPSPDVCLRRYLADGGAIV